MVLSSTSLADIVCKGQTDFGPAEIKIGEKNVTVSGGALERPLVYRNVDFSYDGHESELITAPGLSVSYENWYGCIHNAKVTTAFRGNAQSGNFETIEISQCSGGSTPDEACHVHSN